MPSSRRFRPLAVVLLSPEAVPAVWRREAWETVFIKQAAELRTSLVFLLVRPCKFPVLRVLIEDAYLGGDSAALRLWEWERTWIRVSWGEPLRPRTRLGGEDPQPPTQLGLFA